MFRSQLGAERIFHRARLRTVLRRICAILVAATAFLLVLAPFTMANADTPVSSDTTASERHDDVVEFTAGTYNYHDSYSNCVTFGFNTIRLAAALEAHERGLDNGIAIGDAHNDIQKIVDETKRLIGTGSTVGQCSWDDPSPGSPGALHSALGLGLIMHRYQDDLPQSLIEDIADALRSNYRETINPYLVNGNLSVVAGRLLGGEVLGYDSDLWQSGYEDFEGMYNQTQTSGGLEMNSPVYTPYHFAALAPMVELIEDEEVSNMARIAMDYQLIVQAHLYLPGGAVGAPRSRDRVGGADDGHPSSLTRMMRLLTGEDEFYATNNIHLGPVAISGYEIPHAMRSIFLDKADGYRFRGYSDAPNEANRQRMPYKVYDFAGEGGLGWVSPWEAVITPDAMFGVTYGHRWQAIHVSMGVYARGDDGQFPILYQHQPLMPQDTNDGGATLPSSSGADPDRFYGELYDHQRMVNQRSMISIWDPTLQLKSYDVIRTIQETRTHLPNWDYFGGEMQIEGDWYVGKMGNSYIAYHPLGDMIAEETRDGGEWTYMRLDGRSGGIVELATTDDFATLDDYVDNLKTRHVHFNRGDISEPFHAEFDSYNPDTGQLERMRLEYRPEERFIDGVELPVEALDSGLVESPWVSWDESTQTIEMSRGCYGTVMYDWEQREVVYGDPDTEQCEGAPDPVEGTKFSDVPFYGDFANWEPLNDYRWDIVEDSSGERRLILNEWDWVREGDRIGEYALSTDGDYGDFHLTMDARTNENLSSEPNADYAVVFGWQNTDDYYFFMANANPEYSELFVLEDGERTQLANANASLIDHENWYEFEFIRTGDDIEVIIDGQTVLEAELDGTYGDGRLGIGSFNDSAVFDNIDIARLSGDSGGSDDSGSSDDSGDDSSEDTEMERTLCSTTSGAPSGAMIVFVAMLAGVVVVRRRRREHIV